MLEGRHGGMVGTKALKEDNGPCLLYGYDYGFVFGFLCLLLQGSGGVSNVGDCTGSIIVDISTDILEDKEERFVLWGLVLGSLYLVWV